MRICIPGIPQSIRSDRPVQYLPTSRDFILSSSHNLVIDKRHGTLAEYLQSETFRSCQNEMPALVLAAAMSRISRTPLKYDLEVGESGSEEADVGVEVEWGV
jgi:hypothetical protein